MLAKNNLNSLGIYLSKNNIKRLKIVHMISRKLEVLDSENSLVSSLGITRIIEVGINKNNITKTELRLKSDIFKSLNFIIKLNNGFDPIKRKSNNILEIWATIRKRLKNTRNLSKRFLKLLDNK